MKGKKYYIAYGSNLNVEQMKHRCPGASLVGAGYIDDYQLSFRTYATVEPMKGSRVPVGIWLIDSDNESALDRYEGYPTFYRKEDIEVRMKNDSKLKGMVYIMNEEVRDMDMPSWIYLEAILDGYREVGLDHRYLDRALEWTKDRIN